MLVRDSLSYRGGRAAHLWLAAVARDSLVGRFFLALVRVCMPVFADSRVFGTRRLASRRLGRTGHPVSVLALSRPYLWLRRVVGGSVVGRAARSAEGQVSGSRFSGGAWAIVAGAGLFALGCGRLALVLARGATTLDNTGIPLAAPWLRLAIPIVVLAIGVLMMAGGSRLAPAFATSLAGRGLALATGGSYVRVPAGPAGAPVWRRSAGRMGPTVVGVAAIMAAAGGLLVGLSYGSAPVLVIAAVVVLCVLALVVVRPEALLVVVAVFPWLDWAARNTMGGLGPVWDDALLLFSVCLVLWCVIVLRRWELWTVPILLPTILAFAAALGSVVVREVPGDVALFALRILFQPLLFYFLGFLLPKDRRWVRRTVAVFVLVGVALALHGLYQYVTNAPMPASWVDVRETSIGTRAYSIVQNPNGLGAFLLMGALLSFSLAAARGLRGISRVLWAVACVIHLGGVAVTFSRGAWIGLAAGLVALLIMAYRRYLTPLVAVVVVGWFAAPSTFVQRLTSAFSSWYIAKSMAAGRLYVWKMALEYIAAHPWFGLGLGTFGGTAAVTYSYSRLWVDSFYLQLGAEGGLLLLAFFLWLLLRGAKGLVKGHGATGDPYLRALTAGAFGAYVAVGVANLTASVWETLVVGAGFWFLAGFVTSAALHERETPGGASHQAAPEEGDL
ncbi:MAG: O-antigen ligase family protein [Thermoleophilia bacterium]|nr:O-antigen ligase family protein [Thermoleophilia bacterium]